MQRALEVRAVQAMLGRMKPTPKNSDDAAKTDAIAQFQSLYAKEYGVQLTVEEAQVKARLLIELFKILFAEPSPHAPNKSNMPPTNLSFERELSKPLLL